MGRLLISIQERDVIEVRWARFCSYSEECRAQVRFEIQI